MDDYEDAGFIQSSPKREFTGVRTLRSMTIKQLNSIEVEDASSIQKADNAELSSFIIIGWVRETRHTHTGCIFVLEDGTGSVDCAFWPNGLFEEEQAGLIETDNMLKISGSLRIFNGKKSVSVSFLSKIENYKFMVFHFVQCIYQHLYNSQKIKKDVLKKDGLKMSKIKEDVLQCYRKNQDDGGVHLDVIVKMMSSKYDEKEVRECVDNLLNDCHLYSVDGYEYRTTGS